jgi:hypothetical protein
METARASSWTSLSPALRGGLFLAVLPSGEATAYVHRPGRAITLVPQSDFGYQVSYVFPQADCCNEVHELELRSVSSSFLRLSGTPSSTPQVIVSAESTPANA